MRMGTRQPVISARGRATGECVRVEWEGRTGTQGLLRRTAGSAGNGMQLDAGQGVPRTAFAVVVLVHTARVRVAIGSRSPLQVHAGSESPHPPAFTPPLPSLPFSPAAQSTPRLHARRTPPAWVEERSKSSPSRCVAAIIVAPASKYTSPPHLSIVARYIQLAYGLRCPYIARTQPLCDFFEGQPLFLHTFSWHLHLLYMAFSPIAPDYLPPPHRPAPPPRPPPPPAAQERPLQKGIRARRPLLGRCRRHRLWCVGTRPTPSDADDISIFGTPGPSRRTSGTSCQALPVLLHRCPRNGAAPSPRTLPLLCQILSDPDCHQFDGEKDTRTPIDFSSNKADDPADDDDDPDDDDPTRPAKRRDNQKQGKVKMEGSSGSGSVPIRPVPTSNSDMAMSIDVSDLPLPVPNRYGRHVSPSWTTGTRGYRRQIMRPRFPSQASDTTTPGPRACAACP